MAEPSEETREGEWFVPKVGPRRFRLLVGLTFYPYTLMNVSYVVLGSMLTPGPVHWDRVSAMAAVYLLSTGVSAHSLDALAPNKPWGSVLSKRSLLLVSLLSLCIALLIGGYYAVLFAPFLIPLGMLEIFFLFAYNLELFRGRFHTDPWFAFSWGGLPVLAGFVIQTNSLSFPALAASLFGFSTAFAEINASRPYKALKKLGPVALPETARFENILKALVAGNLAISLTLLAYRLVGH